MNLRLFAMILYFVASIYIIYKVVDACYVKDSDQEIINRVYYLLDEVSTQFDKHDVEYIMVGGTLLGSVRHGGMIPWDDDGDLCVLNKTPEEIIEILKPLKEKSILSRVHRLGNLVIASVNNKIGILDIFFMEDSDGQYKFLYPYNKKYENEWFYEDELYPIRKYIFGPLVLKGPNKYKEYLARSYNDNWSEEAIKWNHKAFMPEKVKLKTFESAFPSHLKEVKRRRQMNIT
jgi:lipopolysaccharide cholinephosphotransferase